MKHIIVSIFLLVFTAYCRAQSQPVLYGPVTVTTLQSASCNEWYQPGYDSYQPDTSQVNLIRKLAGKDIHIEVFFGSWCGDSKRELPHFMKIMQAASFLSKNIQLIGLGRDSLYKQSPTREEAGKGIFRVPVFIIYRNGVELNRINEFPVVSLERDLTRILSGQEYQPNYRSFALLKEWLNSGSLLDKNSSVPGLAGQLRWLVTGEHELNSLGYLLLRQGKQQEALRLFQVNAQLYPESANVLSSLGEGYYKAGEIRTAVDLLERSLALNRDPELVKSILGLLYEIKDLKK